MRKLELVAASLVCICICALLIVIGGTVTAGKLIVEMIESGYWFLAFLFGSGLIVALSVLAIWLAILLFSGDKVKR